MCDRFSCRLSRTHNSKSLAMKTGPLSRMIFGGAASLQLARYFVCLYTSDLLENLLTILQFNCSMSRTRCCFDNAGAKLSGPSGISVDDGTHAGEGNT